MGDLKVSVRHLLKTPGFTLAAIVVLALGIGLNAGMFSVVYALTMAGRAYPEPDRVVQLYSRDPRPSGDYRAFSYPIYQELAARGDMFSGILAHNPTLVGVGDGVDSRRSFSAVVSANYFEVLGVPLLEGRTFTAEEDRPGQDIPVVVASYAHWKRAGFDPALLGKTIRVNEREFTVVGITPQGFTGTMSVFGAELFFPLGVFHTLANDFTGDAARSLQRVDAYNLFLVGRVKDGVEMSAASVGLGLLGQGVARAFPEYEHHVLSLGPLPKFGTSTSPLDESVLATLGAVMMGMTGAVLLTVCLNLASMLLARGRARRKEFAIRLALGGGRTRIVRQLLIEGFVLSLDRRRHWRGARSVRRGPDHVEPSADDPHHHRARRHRHARGGGRRPRLLPAGHGRVRAGAGAEALAGRHPHRPEGADRRRPGAAALAIRAAQPAGRGASGAVADAAHRDGTVREDGAGRLHGRSRLSGRRYRAGGSGQPPGRSRRAAEPGRLRAHRVAPRRAARRAIRQHRRHRADGHDQHVQVGSAGGRESAAGREAGHPRGGSDVQAPWNSIGPALLRCDGRPGAAGPDLHDGGGLLDGCAARGGARRDAGPQAMARRIGPRSADSVGGGYGVGPAERADGGSRDRRLHAQPVVRTRAARRRVRALRAGLHEQRLLPRAPAGRRRHAGGHRPPCGARGGGDRAAVRRAHVQDAPGHIGRGTGC